MCKIVNEAASHLEDVIELKDSIKFHENSNDSSLTRKQLTVSREVHGQAIRGWGSEWRSIVMFALLTEVAEAKESIGMILEAGVKLQS